MVDVDTFLTTLYVMVDDFCELSLPLEPHPGPQAALTRSEVVTLAIFGQWQGFGSERGFYRYAQRHLRTAFPTLPTREQFNRQVRQQYDALVACFLPLVQVLAARQCPYEALDSSGIPTRDAKRRGAGWLPGLADMGWSNRLGWYEGFHLLLAVNPSGAITAAALGLQAPKINPWQKRSLLFAAVPTPAWRAWALQPLGRTSSTRASRAKPIRRSGGGPMAPRSSARPSAIAGRLGPSGSGAGWLECARSWRLSMRSSRIPSASIGNGPMTSAGFRRAWSRRWLFITFACG
jgi:hypothetical protein